MNRFARSFLLVLLSVSVAALIASASASALAPTLSVDAKYGDPATHAATLGRIDKRKLDVTGFAIDAKRRALLIGNNGWENPSDAGPVECEFTTVRRIDAHGAIDKSFASRGVFRFPK